MSNDTVTIRVSRNLAAQLEQRAKGDGGRSVRSLADVALRAALAMWRRDGVVLGKTTEGKR